jgi:hypothetical protein
VTKPHSKEDSEKKEDFDDESDDEYDYGESDHDDPGSHLENGDESQSKKPVDTRERRSCLAEANE